MDVDKQGWKVAFSVAVIFILYGIHP